MTFKAGRLGELWLNGVDVSTFFAGADNAFKVDIADVSTFKSTWRSAISGLAASVLTASGYYDSADADKVRDTLQAAVGQLSYFPAGATAIGDNGRLLNINSSDYKNSSKIADAVVMDWTAQSTAPVGIGTCLHILQSENIGTITGTGDGIGNAGAQTTTGLVAHLHVTAMTGGDTHNFKLQDATTIGGAYTDIAGGAFTNVTAVGSQRLVVPGTIRAFIRLVATINTHAATYGCAAART